MSFDFTNKDTIKNILGTSAYDSSLRSKARELQHQYYGNSIFIRGLIEISNYCKNNCYYCGIRCANKNLLRYRLTKEDILECCKEGYELGFRTFVLQGGEDSHFTDSIICDIVYSIKELYSDCAVTLSLGEKSHDNYKAYFDAGADRYLLRHETACTEHYKKLHPSNMTLENRKHCLYDLKNIGYQVGSGFMVGSPYQTLDNLVEDLLFLKELEPDMIGIGPYILHQDTPFANIDMGKLYEARLELTLKLISVLRIMFPYALIPATTALGTLTPEGRKLGILSGANVIMPNLSPVSVRKLYNLYDNKICTGDESAQQVNSLRYSMAAIGFDIVTNPGHVRKFKGN